MEKNSFVLYTDYYEHVDSLTNEEAGELFKSIFRYAMSEDPGIESRVVGMAFSFIKAQMDKDTEKYNETCRKRAENGAKGGRPKANGFSEKAKKANGFSEKQSKAKKADNDNENDNDNDFKEKESTKKKIFVPPTREELLEYIAEKNLNLDVDRFIDYYTANGWMAGKNKMKDWRATARNWDRNQSQDTRVCRQQSAPQSKIHNFSERQYDYNAMLAELM